MSSTDGVLLIDEPELSLHVDWQRIILSELMAQAGSRQIIACTHAPEVVGDHRERMFKLEPTKYISSQGDLFASPDSAVSEDR
jgi:predicted ATP-dependent endonuclease of OLD family